MWLSALPCVCPHLCDDSLHVIAVRTCPRQIQLLMDGRFINLQVHVLDSWHVLFQELLPLCRCLPASVNRFSLCDQGTTHGCLCRRSACRIFSHELKTGCIWLKCPVSSCSMHALSCQKREGPRESLDKLKHKTCLINAFTPMHSLCQEVLPLHGVSLGTAHLGSSCKKPDSSSNPALKNVK